MPFLNSREKNFPIVKITIQFEIQQRLTPLMYSGNHMSAEDNEIQQMMNNLVNADRMTPDKLVTKKDLDQFPDERLDGVGCPVPGECLMKEGKYGKKGMTKTLEEVYMTDKSYINWVREHINAQSSLALQQLKIYVHHRDAKKKERILRQEPLSSQSTLRPKMKAQIMHAARNMPKVVKARKQPETEENEMEWCTENAEWEQIQDHQGQMIEAWKHLVSQKMVMKQEQIMITTQRIVDGNVGTERLAKFLVQMTQA